MPIILVVQHCDSWRLFADYCSGPALSQLTKHRDLNRNLLMNYYL